MSDQLAQIVAENGVAGVVGILGVGVIFICGFSLFFVLVYSVISKNWNVWKYFGYSILGGIGLIILSLFMSFVAGFFRGAIKEEQKVIESATFKDAGSENSIIEFINVTDFAFRGKEEDGTPFYVPVYVTVEKCDDSIYAPSKVDNEVFWSDDHGVYAFAKINKASWRGGDFTAKWFFEKKHRPLDEDGEENLSAGFVHDGWILFKEENGISAGETCDGLLYAISEITRKDVGENYYDEHPLPSGGTYKVVFYMNDKEVGVQNFSGELLP